MADFRNFLTRFLGPGFLAGVTVSDWFRHLASNQFRVSPSHWGRAAFVTATAPVTSAMKLLEDAVHGRAIQRHEMPPPIVVIGSWRSGTTFLHTLLSTDDRFGCPNIFQTMYPHTFLLGEAWFKPMLELGTPKKRFMDNMKQSLSEPHEDEMALGIISGRSNMLSWVFPHRSEHYDRFLSFEGASEADRQAWKRALQHYVRKVAYKTGKQIILKSPNHTARIRMILETFPDAKFLHIRRNPFDVYKSMCHMASEVIPMWGLGRYPEDQIPEMVIAWYRDLYDAFFDQVGSIPPGQYHEVAYEELAADPVRHIEQAYSVLSLPDFGYARPTLTAHVESQAGYRKNKHVEIDPAIRERLVREWNRSFSTWGYPT